VEWGGQGVCSEWQKEQVVSAVMTTTSVELQYIRVLSTI
jgi:hypothetical protein